MGLGKFKNYANGLRDFASFMFISVKAAPEQKYAPLPVTITAVTLLSFSSNPNTRDIASKISLFHAFYVFGRLYVIVAVPYAVLLITRG